MTKLGELLKSEREKRSLSLHEIGMSLKINPKILKAIEDGDQPNLPAKTFLRGFVKSYAQFLRLDLDQALQMFQEEYGTSAPKVVIDESQSSSNPSVAHPTHAPGPRHENTLKRPDSSALPVSSSNRVYTIVIALVLLTLIAFVAKMMDKYQKESRISESDIPTVEGTVDTVTPTTLPVNAQALSTPADPSAVSTTTLPAGSTTTLVAGTPGSESATTSTSTTSTTLKAATAVAPTATPVTSSTTTTLRSATVTTLAPTTTTTTLRPGTTTTTLRSTSVTTAAPTTTTLRPGTVTTPAPTTTTLRPGSVTAAPTTTTLRPGTATAPAPTTTTLRALPAAGVAPATTATTATTVSSTTLTTAKPPMTEVIVEALNRVSIRFTLNGGQSWESLTLNPDQVHTFRSRTNVQLEFTDGGAVNVIVNGRDRGVPGTIGKPIKLTYP